MEKIMVTAIPSLLMDLLCKHPDLVSPVNLEANQEIQTEYLVVLYFGIKTSDCHCNGVFNQVLKLSARELRPQFLLLGKKRLLVETKMIETLLQE